jgi:hypothetical protein
VREGSVYDALADAVIVAADASEREKVLAAELISSLRCS